MPTTPTPIALHKTRGTYRATRHRGMLEQPRERLGACPEWFSDLQRKEWDRLAAMDHIPAANRAAVEHACVLYSRFVDDAQRVKKMTGAERMMFHSIYMQLGLTPASAAKVTAPSSVKADDPWAALG